MTASDERRLLAAEEAARERVLRAATAHSAYAALDMRAPAWRDAELEAAARDWLVTVDSVGAVEAAIMITVTTWHDQYDNKKWRAAVLTVPNEEGALPLTGPEHAHLPTNELLAQGAREWARTRAPCMTHGGR